jgi:hypothetical protein
MIPNKFTDNPANIGVCTVSLLVRLLIRQFDQLMIILLTHPIPLIEIISIQFLDRPGGHRLVSSFHRIYKPVLVYKVYPFGGTDLSSRSVQILCTIVRIILGQRFIILIFPGRPEPGLWGALNGIW